MEHVVVVSDGFVQEVTGRFIQGGSVLRVLLSQDPIRFRFIGGIAEDRRNAQLLGWIGCHLLFELLIVELCHGHRSHTENGVEAAQPLLLLDLLHHATLCRRHIRNVHQRVEVIGAAAAIRLLIEVIQNVLRYEGDALWGHKCLFTIDIPHLLVFHAFVGVHRLDIVYPEGQHVFIVDGVHDGIGMELIPEHLGSRHELGPLAANGIGSKDGCAGKAKDMIPLEVGNDGMVHLTELPSMALVEDEDDVLLIHRMPGVLLDEDGQFLGRGDDDLAIILFQLLLQDGCGRVAVGRTLLEAIVLLHRLVVQILAIDDEKNLVDIRQSGSKPSRLERCQRFTGTGCMPNVSATGNGAVLLVVGGDVDPVQDTLRRRDLIRTHDEQHLLRSEDTILRQYIQNRMPGKERARKVDQIRNDPVVGIRPEGRELEAVGRLLLVRLGRLRILDGVPAGGVGIILCVGAVADHEDLDILKQTAASPEGIPLISVDLVERFADGHAPSLQLHMDERQAVYQDRDVIAVVMLRPLRLAYLVLIDHLEEVVVNVLFVDKGDIFGGAVVPLQNLDIVLLDLPRLLHDMLIGIRHIVLQEAIPFLIRKRIPIQFLKLGSQVGDQLCFRVDGQIRIPLFREHANELPLQIRLALIAI